MADRDISGCDNYGSEICDSDIRAERVVAEAADEGERLDSFLASKIDGLSRSRAQKLIEEGLVDVCGEPCGSKKYKVCSGDEIEAEIPAEKELEAVPEDIPLDIVYEDDAVLVVNKPRGMAVHPAIGNERGTLANALLYHCGGKLSHVNGRVRPGTVHRIDKDTSGLLMVAKTDEAHESLAEQLKEHTIKREYRAVVIGNIKEDELTIDVPIGRNEKDRLKRAAGGIGAKRAVTHIKVIERLGGYTVIEAALETGRTHQIRVHMAYIKHPVVGDPLYGPKKQPIKTDGQVLHAKTLGFIHPTTGEYMEFDSDLPEYFEEVIGKLRKRKL